MNKTFKSLKLSKRKTIEVDGEHRVIFVASSSNEDRDYEKVIVGTFRLPLKGGGEIRVDAIPEEGVDNVDLPLLSDHNLWEVEKTLGSVRKAYYTNGELIFEAGISSRPYAQDIYKLIEEGHLDNAFSIQFRDYDYNFDAKEATNGEIFEVSLVTRGSNKDARVLEAKGVKEEKTMDPEENKPTGQTTETPVENTEQSPEVTPGQTESVETTTEPEGTESAGSETETKTVKEDNMNKDIQKTYVQAKAPSQAATTAKAAGKGYLASKQAMNDLAKILANNQKMTSANIKRLWQDNLRAKGITGDFQLPTTLEAAFFTAWEEVEADALSTFRRSERRAGTAYAMTGEGEGIEAKGHRKGDTKANQEVTIVQRDLKGLIVYKKLPLDLIDLLEDEGGELLRWRGEELIARLRTAVLKASILSDGRDAPTDTNPDYRMFNGSRGLWSMVGDLVLSTSNATSNEVAYAKQVARTIENSAEDDIYTKVVKTLAKVRPVDRTLGQNRRKVFVIDPSDMLELRLSKSTVTGGYMFQPGTDFEETFGAKIIELDGVKNSGFDVIGYANQGYTLLGTDNMIRTDFDLDLNQDVMLAERLVAGSLEGYHVCAGYLSTES